MEPVFRTLEIAAKAVLKATGTAITYRGLDHIPQSGGAVIAINHTSYVDFLPAALATHYRRRRIRFMIKAEMQQVRIVRYLIEHTGTIPVNRRAGADAYQVAVAQLRAGELVGVYPEATISRSFELKEFKSGVARMALEAQVPIVPLVVWGAQRIWTKDHPKRLGRNKIPITVGVGAPLSPSGSAAQLEAKVRESMDALLRQAQRNYPHPEGAYWVPQRMGGAAPSVEQGKVLDEVELAERARKRADSQ